jgi:hypothetical protein
MIKAKPVMAQDRATRDRVAGTLIQFNENGAWCWYQDPRVLFDPASNTLLISSIGTSEGIDGADRSGDVDVVAYPLDTGIASRAVLHNHFSPQDDHNAAALLLRPDGRYLAMYARHNLDDFSYWRISARPHDAGEWGPEQTYDWSAAIKQAGAHSHVTYSNLFYLSAEGKTYNFSRAINDDPSILVSNNNGDQWTYAGKLLTEEKLGYVNGYTKYASNGKDRIDFITTEHHPRDYNNSIYHGYIQGGKLHKSDGTVVEENLFASSGHPQTELTTVFPANSMFDGTIMTHAWTMQVAVDSGGRPYGVISARANDQPEDSNFSDHRFFYIRYDGKRWQVNELAKAGACLWDAEQDYTGLATVDPADPSVVYISTTIDPRNDQQLSAHEIFRGQSGDGGKTWKWTALTSGSSVDNLRPLAVRAGDRTVVVWFRGTMSRSQHYDSAMVGTIVAGNGIPEENVNFVETSEANVEGGKISTPPVEAGTYNVYAFFWDEPGGDTRISAGLAADRVMVYRSRSAQSAEASQFSQSVKLADGNRLLYRAYLGRVKIEGGKGLDVYVKDSAARALAGVGYQKAG